ncbi:hypothetical protein EniLVp02_0033 [Vibrio phage EniLVp02]
MNPYLIIILLIVVFVAVIGFMTYRLQSDSDRYVKLLNQLGKLGATIEPPEHANTKSVIRVKWQPEKRPFPLRILFEISPAGTLMDCKVTCVKTGLRVSIDELEELIRTNDVGG